MSSPPSQAQDATNAQKPTSPEAESPIPEVDAETQAKARRAQGIILVVGALFILLPLIAAYLLWPDSP